MITEEKVVLLDETGGHVGVANKAEVHTTATPLHLAFSCHVIDDDGRVLVTRRALHKRTWPGVWTNSFCGHPAPDEPMADAVRRRGVDELGLALTEVELVDPDFRYRAVDASGIVENEMCPIYVARTGLAPVANPDEVMDLHWLTPAQLRQAVEGAPFAMSPWLVSSFDRIAGFLEA
ncbi:isopentenyl-diphosphate Delta-isomerase [Cellulomonas sp. SLBN-39]|uniref:isopentenyl-diphosphate Delta-isomerase n=1 Tax=Cellulomonas sp. SLBN-39 TaxID=2768446 RepID=UPI001153B0DD|nr:isopentenyl-diphosphate Delta-isomerase [Cellulomonas sp. SLBN-39]TQL02272.1 isopentenyl-diphosphate delta-isomerase [Cellulomonas sp. SLBN-39]